VIYNLQLLRAVAALVVVFAHACSSAGFGLGLSVGAFGVDIFFVISGFTISYVGSNLPAKVFLTRRLIRIVPLYWGATFGAYSITVLAPSLIQSTDSSVVHLLYSLFFIPHLNKVGYFEPTLALGWSLNYEMYFYFLFSLGLLVSVRWAPILCSLFMLVIAGAILTSGTTNAAVLLYADPIVLEFIGGILIFYIYNSESVATWLRSHQKLAKTLLLGLGTIAFVVIVEREYAAVGTERALRAGIPAFVIVLAAVMLEKVFAYAIKRKTTVLLGDASYVLYLTHPYVVYGSIRLFLSHVSLGPLGTWAAVVVLLAMATAVAVAIHLLLERPVLSLLRRMTATSHPVSTIQPQTAPATATVKELRA